MLAMIGGLMGDAQHTIHPDVMLRIAHEPDAWQLVQAEGWQEDDV